MLKRVTLRDPATEIYTTLLHVSDTSNILVTVTKIFDHLSFGVEFHHMWYLFIIFC